MIINNYTCPDLKNLLSDEEFWNQEIIPISKNRILAQINNPMCDPEDILLSTITNDSKLEGFIGFLPEKLIENGKQKKVYWISTWWSNPDSSLRGVGTILLLNGLKEHQRKLGVSIFTSDAKKVYDQLGIFSKIHDFNGYLYIFSISFDQLVIKIPKLLSLKKPLTFIFDLINQCFYFIQKISWYLIPRYSTKYKSEVVKFLDDEVQEFISPFVENNLTLRNADYFNWANEYPWLISGQKDHENDPFYPFSWVTEKSFEFKNIVIRNQQEEIVAFIILTIRDDVAKVPYIFCQPDYYKIAALEILRIVRDRKLSILIIFNEALIQALKNKLLHIKIPYKKEMIGTDEFLGEMDPSSKNIQDGDADWLFT